MADKANGSIGSRLLIILYAAGIVAIGLQPIRENHGGIWNYFKHEAKQLSQKIENLQINKVDLQNKKGSNEPQELRTIVIGDGATEKGDAGNRARLSSTTPTTYKQLDNLTKEDREKLNKLIENLK